ncbi:hypothetical protein B0H16DRAFT_1465537 [Mycena metata]|uniref:Uncharacterized protein n=1 Tax=Mycena metata TaxID=1033252 RepID=A0AAD7IAW0_9AGAR|nr:hypothetical protein B0H16DRAFT_1465537 [Mycena metata]
MPRKRARSSSASGRESDDEEVVIPTRDAEYYDEEGDCVVRIENVLFKPRLDLYPHLASSHFAYRPELSRPTRLPTRFWAVWLRLCTGRPDSFTAFLAKKLEIDTAVGHNHQNLEQGLKEERKLELEGVNGALLRTSIRLARTAERQVALWEDVGGATALLARVGLAGTWQTTLRMEGGAGERKREREKHRLAANKRRPSWAKVGLLIWPGCDTPALYFGPVAQTGHLVGQSKAKPRANETPSRLFPEARDNPEQGGDGSPIFGLKCGFCMLSPTSRAKLVTPAKTLYEQLHRVHLTRHSEAIAGMFGVPQGDLPADGQTDERPVVLMGDTVAQFRAFLRYSFAAYVNPLSRRTIPDVSPLSPRATQYSNLQADEMADVARVGHFANKYLMTEVWKDQLTRGVSDHADALDAGEVAGQRKFMTDVYYHALARKPSQTSTTPAATQFPLPRLSPVHVQRLFAGQWSLTMLGIFISNNPPRFQLPTGFTPPCTDHVLCTRKWDAVWKERMHSISLDEFSLTDVIGRLYESERRMRTGAHWDGGRSGAPACFDLIIREKSPFQRVREGVRESLETRFFGAAGFIFHTPINAA